MASERVRALLQDKAAQYRDEDPPSLFIQMDEFDLMSPEARLEDAKWEETKRWIRYEENVEGQGERWSKPHVSTVSLQAVLDLKQDLRTSIVQLEVADTSMSQLIDTVVQTMAPHHGLSERETGLVRDVLSRPHAPQILLRELKDKKKPAAKSLHHYQSKDTDHEGAMDAQGVNFEKSKIDKRFTRKLPLGAETANIFVGEINGLSRPISCLVRLKSPFMFEGVTEVESKTRFLFIVLGPQKQAYPKQYREIGRALATLLCDEVFHQVAYSATSGQDIVDGIDEFLEAVTLLPPSNWTANMPIDPPPMRPEARRKDLIRLKNPSKQGTLTSSDSLVSLALEVQDEESDGEEEQDPTLYRTGRLFGGLVADMRRALPRYLSDFKDAAHLQCISSTIFLYFAAFTPIVTFGALMGEGTHEFIGTIEFIVAGAICGVIYHMFAGQPLTVLGPTGPMFVLEVIVFHFSEDNGLSYLSFRLWIGIWTGFLLILLVAFDLSALVAYITRFTEEAFASLISAIFVYDAIRKLADIRNFKDTEKFLVECFCKPVNNDTGVGLGGGNGTNATLVDFLSSTVMPVVSYVTASPILNITRLPNDATALEDKECFENHGTLMGCHHVGHSREIFHLSILWFLLTFTIATTLHWFRSSRFLPSKVRSVVSDFCVFIAILIVSMCDALVGIGTPKLITPAKFAPSHPNRDWVIRPLDNLPWWAPLAAILPAVIATILVFMDQQITTVIINRKDNRMKKGSGYHLDLLVVAILIIICSIFGLPWYVASTVVAITHVTSLRKESECCAPGDVPYFTGIREQRVTGILAHVLIGLSILFTPLLSRVPLPVLYGVFLYMGVSSLNGLMVVDRILILFMPAKYQPEYPYLTAIPARRVHLFTIIQVFCFILLLVIKKIKVISMGFPIMVLGLCFVRNVIIERIFTPFELKKLDNLLPKKKKKFVPNINGTTAKETELVNLRSRKPWEKKSENFVENGNSSDSNKKPSKVEKLPKFYTVIQEDDIDE